MSVPATIQNELMDDINNYATKALDEFNYHLLMRKADKLLAVDQPNGHFIKGVLSALIWDVQAARKYLSKAETLAPYDAELLRNIAITYGRLSFDTEARECYLRVHKMLRSSPEILIIYLQSCVGTNRPDLAQEAVDIFISAGGDVNDYVKKELATVEMCARRLKLVDVSTEIAASIYAAVGDVLRNFKVRDNNSRVWLNNEDGVTYLAGMIEVGCDVAIISSMNAALTEQVVANFSFEDSDKLIYQFVPADDSEAMAENINQFSKEA